MAWKAKFKKATMQGIQKPYDKLKIEIEFTESASGESFIKEYLFSVWEIAGEQDLKDMVGYDLWLLQRSKQIENKLATLSDVDFVAKAKPVPTPEPPIE